MTGIDDVLHAIRERSGRFWWSLVIYVAGAVVAAKFIQSWSIDKRETLAWSFTILGAILFLDLVHEVAQLRRVDSPSFLVFSSPPFIECTVGEPIDVERAPQRSASLGCVGHDGVMVRATLAVPEGCHVHWRAPNGNFTWGRKRNPQGGLVWTTTAFTCPQTFQDLGSVRISFPGVSLDSDTVYVTLSLLDDSKSTVLAFFQIPIYPTAPIG